MEEEVFLSTLSDLDGDKAPRPDAFSLAFWNSWPIVGRKVMQLFEEFYTKLFFVCTSMLLYWLLFLRRKGWKI